MTKLLSLTTEVLWQIKRNSTISFSNLSFGLLFSLLFNLLGRVYLVLAKAKLENQKDLDPLSLVDTQQQLILFLSILQLLTLAAILTAAVLGTLYYSTIFTKHFLASKEEFMIKKYLGAFSWYVSLPLFLETWLVLMVGFGLGIKVIRLLYQVVADHSGQTLRSYLIQPVYFIEAVELPLFAALTVIPFLLTLSAHRKIRTY
ncbi:hypothetical protein [Candidatus Enterococcus ferrettii]|uniref:FtsX-like permease family protein n=1 Tax=Candidatus Enterococcus ferrettii TaxID=2815324 RepID=A0ABV0EYR1_9ENTE|nr:hypothetical protein [Enterococcus sp. 665A]MBO1343159.1 hypothetical protein [Enterococcus sp. 665A]